jgi:hypothetical protein
LNRAYKHLLASNKLINGASAGLRSPNMLNRRRCLSTIRDLPHQKKSVVGGGDYVLLIKLNYSNCRLHRCLCCVGNSGEGGIPKADGAKGTTCYKSVPREHRYLRGRVRAVVRGRHVRRCIDRKQFIRICHASHHEERVRMEQARHLTP